MLSEQKLLRSILLLTIVLFGCLASTKAQTSEINYQGSLKNGSAAANGSYDMQFQN